MKGVTSEWLKEKGLVELSPGKYGRANMLDKALKQSLPPEGLFEALPVTIFGSKEHIATKDQKSLTEAKNAPKENMKIKNAVKVTSEGETFDSRLEFFFYGLLKQFNIRFRRQVTFVLQDKFRYGKELIRPITLTVDYILDDYNLIVDPKGYANDRAPLKYKMLKKHLFDQGIYMEIELPRNHKDCNAIIDKLIKKV